MECGSPIGRGEGGAKNPKLIYLYIASNTSNKNKKVHKPTIGRNNMELCIKVYFYIAAVALILRVVCLMLVDYPREVSKNSDGIGLLLILPLIFWAFSLIY